jgi:hypothetical protein
MANTFKNFRAVMTTGGVTAYTAGTGVTAIILSLQVANVDGVNSADATVHWTDASNSNAVTRLGFTVVIPAQTAVSMLVPGTKHALEVGDTIVATASADGDLELSGTVLEMT